MLFGYGLLTIKTDRNDDVHFIQNLEDVLHSMYNYMSNQMKKTFWQRLLYFKTNNNVETKCFCN